MGRQLTEEEIARGMRVSRWLHYYQALKGLTRRKDFAKALGCSPQAVGQWLDYNGGPKGRPSIDALFALHEKLGADPEKIFARTPTDEEIARAGPRLPDDAAPRTKAASTPPVAARRKAAHGG